MRRPIAETFEAFYSREYSAVLALAAVLSGSPAVAEDVTQEAFVAAFRQWDRVGVYDQPGAWVRRVVANQAASAARRRVRDSAIVARLAGRRSPPSHLPELPDAEFWSEVRVLPRRQAQCVALFYLEDRSVADIAAILTLSESTVRVHLHAGRQRLATRLRESYQEDQP
jgi:RNA polymerase sigma-70 factor (ECF subfamily)